MAIIEYDKSPNITPEQRINSLADSVRRAFEGLENDIVNPFDNNSVLPMTNGGTGANSSSAARKNMGIMCDVGTIASENIAAGAYREVNISFKKKFDSTPIVFFHLISSSEAGEIGNIVAAYVPNSGTKTGCKVRIYNGGTSTRAPGLEWKALSGDMFK